MGTMLHKEERPLDVLKASQKDLLGNFEPLLQMHFYCIIFNFVLPKVCLKH